MDKTQKILFNALGAASVVGFVYASWNVFKLLRESKGEEKKSGIDGNLKTVVFTLTNNTNQTQEEWLFDKNSGQDNVNVGISPSIDFFNNELSNKPKVVKKIEFRNIKTVAAVAPAAPKAPAPAAPIPAVAQYNQAEAPFKMNCKDASGNASSKQYLPMVSTNQFQAGITSVEMNEILDGGCFMKYTMYPNSKVGVVVYYEDYPISGLLGKKKEDTKKELSNNKNNMKTQVVERQPYKAAVSFIVVLGGLSLLYKYLSK